MQINRERAGRLGEETRQILAQSRYIDGAGAVVELGPLLDQAVAGARSYLSEQRCPRLRAVALVELPAGVLLVGVRGMGLMLPGGGVHAGERVEDAAVRELREETTLVATQADFLLHYDAYQFRHSVFWVRAGGTPVPSSEITSLAYYRPGAALNLAPVTRAILTLFEQLRRADLARFAVD